MMDLPTNTRDIRASHAAIVAQIQQLEANIKIEKAKLAAIQSICLHPNLKIWRSNAMGRWPAVHRNVMTAAIIRKHDGRRHDSLSRL